MKGTDWRAPGRTLRDTADRLLSKEVPDADLLECLNLIEGTLKDLHEFKRGLWRKVLWLAESKTMTWEASNDRSDD